MHLTGLFLIIATAFAPILWFVELTGRFDTGAMISQYLGCLALILMALIQLQGTRFRWIETVFGRLDRVYVLHKWTAVCAILAVLLHDSLDADFKKGPDGGWSDFAEQLGEWSYYGLLVLGIASVITLIPYRIWRWSHRFIGIFFGLGAVHYLLIDKPFALTDPLGLYVTGFCLMGILAYLFCVLRAWLIRGHAYQVADVTQAGGLCYISMRPKGKPLAHKAGQFAFLTLNAPGLTETHPFTLSQAPSEDGALRFSIAPLGDYTTDLIARAKPGTDAQVTGGFGHFLQPSSQDPQIWVAAGAGVTPFLAWLDDMTPDPSGASIDFYLSVQASRFATVLRDIQGLVANLPQVTLHMIDTETMPRFSFDHLLNAKGVEALKISRVAFCGPTGLRKALQDGLEGIGQPSRFFLYEAFEMRTGLGLGRPLLDLTHRICGQAVVERFMARHLPRLSPDILMSWFSQQFQRFSR